MMERSGGGLITNGRTKQDNGIPQAAPMKPMAQPAPQAAPAPQQQAPAPQPQPQQPPMQQGGAPMQGQPQQPGMEQQGQQGENHVASNALRLLHDPQAGAEFEKMIQQGEKGAAQAAVTIGKQVLNAHQQQGDQVDPEQAAEAIMMVLEDIGTIGVNQGYLSPEPVIDGQPASVMAMAGHAIEMWSEAFPEFGQEMAAAAQGGTPEDDQSAQQLAQYMGAGNGN